jgi:CBS domain-containing protein
MSAIVVKVYQGETVASAGSTTAREGVGCLIVTDEKRVKGIVTDRDIVVRCVAEHQAPAVNPIGEIVSSPVHSAKPTDDITDAARLMTHAKIKRLLVMEDEEVVDLISHADVARAMEQPMHDLLAVEGMGAALWDS